MHLTLKLIGIIVVACIGTGNDPCNTPPYTLQAFLAPGKFTSYPCVNELGKPPRHRAYIRIHQAVQPGTNWPGVQSCSEGPNCFLYPLNTHDAIYIDGVSNGSGMTAPFLESSLISWSQLEPGTLLSPAAAQSAAASIAIRSGAVENHTGKNGMIYAEGNFDLPNPTLRIIAEGTNRQIVLRGDAEVDLINLEPIAARGIDVLGTTAHTPHPEHFFLHYLLAKDKPTDCKAPKETTPSEEEPNLGASVFCSNSNYP